jgi:hypothetical protein
MFVISLEVLRLIGFQSIRNLRKVESDMIHHKITTSDSVLNKDLYDEQTISKPNMVLCIPKTAMCKLSFAIFKPENLGYAEEFFKIQSVSSCA